ncbi:MAG: hypothetical protein IKL65_05525 [Bacilli bacterium]|nr:hypothetical protein [Bacilli bacterium]MBR6690773.1 hypothetical protein [Bacilli bacterium]
MAKYTFELRELFEPIKFTPTLFSRENVEGWFKDYELTDYLTEEQIQTIEDFGIWSKDKLARKIVDHYYMRESGFETVGLFKHYAKVTMQEIMEKYLPLIYSSSIKYDPLVNVDYTETFEREAENTNETTSTGNTTSNTSNNSSGLNVNSDTPQGQINKQAILSGTYASNTTASETEGSIEDTTDTTTESSATGNTNENYTKRVKGNSGVSATAQKMVEQYRQNIIAIDSQIIKELQVLFMGLY